ncbi:MAG: lipocalin family protein [Acidobacteriota bacterium]|nr:lipocalin family protein [Acidobacteriota bacterium]
MPRPNLKFATAALIAAFSLCAVHSADAQSAAAIPKLDPNRLTGTYFEIARYPTKREKQCLANEMVLYALGDKPRAFQIVTSCQVKQDNSEYWNKSGKLDKAANGQIKLGAIWPFSVKYWVIAIAPDYSWALVGNPNHKSLWILSRTPTLAPDVLSSIRSQASAQGFDTAKLIAIPQTMPGDQQASAPPEPHAAPQP